MSRCRVLAGRGKKQIDAYRTLAEQEYKRKLQVWALAYIVQAETEKEARDFYDYYVNQKGDWEAAKNVITTIGLNAKTFPPERARQSGIEIHRRVERHPAGRHQGADRRRHGDAVARPASTGLMISWPRYEEGMRDFGKTTLPLLKQAGLR